MIKRSSLQHAGSKHQRMRYIDHRGQAISLGKELGAGGEGAVFEIVGEKRFVAKIYHAPAPPEKSQKLSLMVRFAPPGITDFAAWPLATLHANSSGPTLGLIIPRINTANEVHELYSPAHRKTHFPQADWKFVLRAARNCAIAFNKLHQFGIVIGDVNQGNIFVTRDALVRLIDCDSFQFSTNGRLFRCPVGVAHFVPPELQGARFGDVTRTPNHDNFGLAVVIFHLLFMGRHPFAGRYSGPGDMPIEKAIREFRFAFSEHASRLQMAPPPHSLTLAHLPDSIAQMFELAFSSGSHNADARPTAASWASALERLEASIRSCHYDSGHIYWSQLNACPWCQIIGQGGPNLFISVSIRRALGHRSAFDLQRVWSEIEGVRYLPEDLYQPSNSLPLKVKPRPIPPSLSTNLVRPFLAAATTLTASLVPVGMWYGLPGALLIPLSLFYAVWWLVLTLKSPRNRILRERNSALKAAHTELKRLRDRQRSTADNTLAAFQKKRLELEQLKNKLEQLEAKRNAEVQTLNQQLRQRQLDAHLQQCFLHDARIHGIGPTRIATLESYGVETAYDIRAELIRQVPGFGPAFTSRLLTWRKAKEAEFRYSPGLGLPQSVLGQVDLKYAQLRLQIEHQLLRGPDDLRRISSQGRKDLEKVNITLARLNFEVAQRQVDLELVSRIPWWK